MSDHDRPSVEPATSIAPPAAARVEAAQLVTDPLLASLDEADRATLTAFLEPIEVPANTIVVKEGEYERTMYFVLAGEAVMSRGEVDLGRVRPGAHVGELGLVGARPRAASVVALTPMALARLTLAGYQSLTAQQPELAFRFLQALMDSVAKRLVDMTDSVGLLLHDRSLQRRTEVSVSVSGSRRVLRTGMPVGALLPVEVDGEPVVAALIDRKAVSLISPVIAACSIEPLTTAHWEAQRIYRHSIALLLLEAAARAGAPPLRMGHSMGFAQRVTLLESLDADGIARLAQDLTTAMHVLVAEEHVLREELWAVDEAREHFAASGWSEVLHLLQMWRDPTVPLASYGQVYALRTGPFLPRTGMMEGFRVLGEEDGLLLIYGLHGASRPVPVELHVDEDLGAGVERAARVVVIETAPAGAPPADEAQTDAAAPAPPGVVKAQRQRASSDTSFVTAEARAVSRHALAMTEEHARWLMALQMDSVGAFNRACVDGDVTQLILVSEGFQEKRISRIADEIRACEPLVKVVCIAGPSSAGKSTFIRRLRVQLQVLGLRPVGVALDDYYLDREQTPRDARGEYDYEAFEAMRGDLLQEHIARLLHGEGVATARFDFRAGRSHPAGGPVIQLGEHDVLMLEGIHGLNPRLLASIPEQRVFRIFVCPLTQLPFDRLTRVYASDVRLLRRIVRDRYTRGSDAAANILRWPSVRVGERKHIFPFQRYADAVFDSSLIYELSVLKVYAERYLLEVPREHPAYTTAFRLLGLLDRFVSIYPEHVPRTSLLREFIGGSGFEY
jgi:uridine kinase/CRP-like cAMP-binding protein